MTIEAVKEYLRIDEDADDGILALMMDAARQYIVDAVGRFDETNCKAQLLFFLLVQDFYENRVLVVKEVDRQRLTHVAGSLVLQLQVEEMADGTCGEAE